MAAEQRSARGRRVRPARAARAHCSARIAYPPGASLSRRPGGGVLRCFVLPQPSKKKRKKPRGHIQDPRPGRGAGPPRARKPTAAWRVESRRARGGLPVGCVGTIPSANLHTAKKKSFQWHGEGKGAGTRARDIGDAFTKKGKETLAKSWKSWQTLRDRTSSATWPDLAPSRVAASWLERVLAGPHLRGLSPVSRRPRRDERREPGLCINLQHNLTSGPAELAELHPGWTAAEFPPTLGRGAPGAGRGRRRDGGRLQQRTGTGTRHTAHTLAGRAPCAPRVHLIAI